MGWNAARVRKKQKEEGRTTEWLARFCGVESVETFQHYLSGRRKPKRPIIKLIAMALHTTEDYLTAEENQSESVPERTELVG